QMPHALELPGMLRAVVPLMRGKRLAGFGRRIVSELVAVAFGRTGWGGWFPGRRSGLMPGFTAVVRALNYLPEPSARLRGVDAIGINGRAFEVIHLPAREMRAADVPLLAFAVCSKNECAFACANQNTDVAHFSLLNFYVWHFSSKR